MFLRADKSVSGTVSPVAALLGSPVKNSESFVFKDKGGLDICLASGGEESTARS